MMATSVAVAPSSSSSAAAATSTTGPLGGPDPEVIAAVEQRGNVVVFFDMMLGGTGTGTGKGGGETSSSSGAKQQQAGADLGRIKLELFVKDVSPCVLRLCSLVCACVVLFAVWFGLDHFSRIVSSHIV